MYNMTMMTRNTVAILMMLLLPVLFGAAQARAVEYKNSYQRPTVNYQLSAISYQSSAISYQQSAAAPCATFRSTSAMPVSVGADTGTLNADGSVNAEAYGVGRANIGPRRSGTNPGTPSDEDEKEEEQQPLGDMLLPLALLAMVYSLVSRTRRRRI